MYIKIKLIFCVLIYLSITPTSHAQNRDAVEMGKYLPNQIIIDPNHPTKLVYNRDQDGDGKLDPFFMCGPGGPEGFLYGEISGGDTQDTILDRMIEHGGNCIYIQGIRSHGGDGKKDHNPFIDHDPAKGLDHEVLDRWEKWFQRMEEHGIVICFFFYDDSVDLWKTDEITDGEKHYIQGIVNKFEHHPNLIWVIAEEYMESLSKEKVSKLAALIKETDDYDHIVGNHQLAGLVFDHPDDPHIEQFTMQMKSSGPHEDVHEKCLQALKNAGGKYNIVLAEQIPFHSDLLENQDRDGVRKVNWSAAITGIPIMHLGTWETAIGRKPPTSEMLQDYRRLYAFMESIADLNEMTPKDHIVQDGNAWVLGNNNQHIAYLIEGGNVTLEISDIEGSMNAEWYNPRDGSSTACDDYNQSNHEFTFHAPDRGDWVLHLKTTDKSAYFPPSDSEGGWRTLEDAEDIRRVAGMDIQKLDEAFEIAESSTKNGGLLVVRKGWLVYEKYFGLGHRDATPNLASCAKSFTSIAVGVLMDERPDLFHDGLDQKIFTPDYFPAEMFPLADPAMAEIKLGQLLAFTAGIRGNNPAYVDGEEITINPPGPDGWHAMVDEVAYGKREIQSGGSLTSIVPLWCEPGGGYSYATSSAHLASIMIRHIAGMELEEYIRKRLAEPMGWGDFTYAYKYAKEIDHTPGGGGIAVRATDMLRFGYMLLHEGRWNDRQLVPAEFVRHASRKSPYNPHSPYSLQFDVNTDGQIPEYPQDAFWKSGSGAHMIYIVPSLDLVVWKLAGRDGQYSEGDTGVSLKPEIVTKAESRKNWKPTLNDREGQRVLLQKVIEAIVE